MSNLVNFSSANENCTRRSSLFSSGLSSKKSVSQSYSPWRSVVDNPEGIVVGRFGYEGKDCLKRKGFRPERKHRGLMKLRLRDAGDESSGSRWLVKERRAVGREFQRRGAA